MFRALKPNALVPVTESLLALLSSGLDEIRSLFSGLSQIILLKVSELVLFPVVPVEQVLLFEPQRCFVKPEVCFASSVMIPSIVLFLEPLDETDIAELFELGMKCLGFDELLDDVGGGRGPCLYPCGGYAEYGAW